MNILFIGFPYIDSFIVGFVTLVKEFLWFFFLSISTYLEVYFRTKSNKLQYESLFLSA